MFLLQEKQFVIDLVLYNKLWVSIVDAAAMLAHTWPHFQAFEFLVCHTSRSEQGDQNFPDDIFKCVFLSKFHWILFPRVQLTVRQYSSRLWPKDG